VSTEAKAKRDSSGLIGAWNAGRSVKALRIFHPRRAFKVAHERGHNALFFYCTTAYRWKHRAAFCRYWSLHA